MPVYPNDPRLRCSRGTDCPDCGINSSDGAPRRLTLAPAVRSTDSRLTTSPDPLSIFPQRRRFAVVKMDPVAMVKAAGLDDPVAIAQATNMTTKKYLVYLESVLGLPMPQSEWCRYRVRPVASTLRPECPDWGITPDMVLPIHPNTAHLVVPSPFVDDEDPNHTFKFPFKNCFFWVEDETELRLRVRHGGDMYDDRKAVSLELMPHLRLVGSFKPHISRIGAYLQGPEVTSPRHPPTAASFGIPSMPPDPYYEALRGQLPSLIRVPGVSNIKAEDRTVDKKTPSDTSKSDLLSIPSPVEQLLSLDLFGWQPSLATKYLPLVDCWFELDEHLSESTIPSPVELWTEQQRIGAIINAAIERHNAAQAAAQSTLEPSSLEMPRIHANKPSQKAGSRPGRLFSGIVTRGLGTFKKAFPGRSNRGSGVVGSRIAELGGSRQAPLMC